MHSISIATAILLSACSTTTLQPEGTTPATPTPSPLSVASTTERAEDLPPPPWGMEHTPGDRAPWNLVAAWQQASNRDWCAPILPTTVDMSDARAVEFEGGWAVELDQAHGRTLGFMGTAMRVDDEDPAVAMAERRSWSDGSEALFEVSADEDGALAQLATIKIAGQECVYQAWAMGPGNDLDQLVAGLRLVDMP